MYVTIFVLLIVSTNSVLKNGTGRQMERVFIQDMSLWRDCECIKSGRFYSLLCSVSKGPVLVLLATWSLPAQTAHNTDG